MMTPRASLCTTARPVAPLFVLTLLGLLLVSGTAAAQGGPPAGNGQAGDAPADSDADASSDAGDAASDGADAAQGSQDIEALRQEYVRLRDELFRSRARAAAVASALYSTQLRLLLSYETGRFYTITRATIRLDGANVYDDTSGAIATDRAPRFEGFVAPGRHVVTIRIEATGKDDERFTTATETTFVIEAPAGKDVVVTARARDSGDMAFAWKSKERGSYQLGLDIKVETTKRPGQAAQKQAQTQAPKQAPSQAQSPLIRPNANSKRADNQRADNAQKPATN